MIQTIFLLELVASVVSFNSQNCHRDTYNISKILLYTALIITACNLFVAHISNAVAFHIINFAGVQLQLMFQFDYLASIMLTVVLSISLIIYQYAERYLESDVTRPRFLAQLCLITLSVSILVLSGNLLTAFIGWQFIGISLYITLNHYHFDANANRASKKKFVINRWGDMCFLAAVILCYQHLGQSTYSALYHYPDTGLIGLLIFIAIMTKSAQFPFHIWLPDTMEAPTPVSALMHAGVINSGGFLLARLAPVYVKHVWLMYLICWVGFVTALMGSLFMMYQYDTKKRLAYSTMGQMGYMILQCGLGAFASAVFHLITHGFYKASLFLNAGSTLVTHKQSSYSRDYSLLISALAISALLMVVSISWALSIQLYLPVLMWFFIASSLLELVKANLTSRFRLQVKLLNLAVIGVVVILYLALLGYFVQILSYLDKGLNLSLIMQYCLGIIILSCQISYWFYDYWQYLFDRRLKLLLINKLYVEKLLRYCFLNRLRQVGDVINLYFQQFKPWSYRLLFLALLGLALVVSLLAIATPVFINCSILALLIIMLVTVIAANRGAQFRGILIWLGLFELAMINLALVSDGRVVSTIGFYHLLNIGTLLVVLSILVFYQQETSPTQLLEYSHNKLGWRKAYVATMLILMLGIPGTASFVTEYYIFDSLIAWHVIYALLFGFAMIVLSISILHCLQLYIFDQNPIYKNYSQLSLSMHVMSWLVIGVNLISGVHPIWMLNLVGIL